MVRKFFSIVGSIICLLLALFSFVHSSYLWGVLFLFAAAQSIYRIFFAVPVVPAPTNITTFEDIKNAVTQRGASGLFIGKISELERSTQWSAFASEVIQAQSLALNAVGRRGVATGNLLLDVGLNIGMKAGLSKALSAGTDVLVAQFSDGTHLSATLPTGVTRSVSEFLSSSMAMGIPVEGNTKKAAMIGRPILVLIGITVLIVVAGIIFG